jgi:hypothetical protein
MLMLNGARRTGSTARGARDLAEVWVSDLDEYGATFAVFVQVLDFLCLDHAGRLRSVRSDRTSAGSSRR